MTTIVLEWYSISVPMITYFETSFFVGGIITFFLFSLLILDVRKNNLVQTYLLAMLACTMWSLGFFAFILASSYEKAYFWRSFMDFGAILIPVFWAHFVFLFLNVKNFRLEIVGYYVITFFLEIVNFVDYFYHGLFVKEIVSKSIFKFYPTASFGYYCFFIFYTWTVFRTLFLLAKHYYGAYGLVSKQLKFLFLAACLGFFGGGTTFLLTFNINILPYGVLIYVVHPIAVGYSVFKYKLFNLKIMYSQFLISILTVSTFMIAVISEGLFHSVINWSVFMVVCMISVILYKNIIKTVDQKNKIEELNLSLADLNSELSITNSTLEEKVKEQTVAVRRAYEVERKANENLKKLDQNKNDFIIVTQHHLRTPISQIRWYLDSISNGLYGPVSKDISNAVENITSITDKLSKILNHFLDIVQLKVGNKVFSMETVDLRSIFESVLYDLKQDLKKKSITVEFSDEKWPELKCDPEKIGDVAAIVFDNAIKYNKSGGVIYIRSMDKKDRFVIKISNEGIKMNQSDLSSILKDSFYRSVEAKKINPTGMGVSLLVARTIMTAHKGSILLGLDKEGRSEVALEFKK